MIKLLLIGLKDLKIIFRDRAALIMMLLAPFLLTVGMGLVTGRFSGNENSNALNIPIIIVNLDNDSLGNALVDVFTSQELADLVEPTLSEDAEAARRLVDEDEITTAIIIPEGFTKSVIPENEIDASKQLQIELYANPSRPTSSGIIKALVDGFTSRISEMRVGGMTTISQLLISGKISPEQANQVGEEMGKRFESQAQNFDETLIKLNTQTSEEKANEFDMLAFFAPAMALMFLMYTVSYGGRSILAERTNGTLTRLFVSPTNNFQILGGKVFGIFLTGAAQVFILIGGTTLFFQLQWGDALGVIALVLAAVFGATGWGLFITAIARTPSQVGSLGTTLMLIFGILGGSFIDISNLPDFVQTISRITPNAWALDGFTTLALGGKLASLTSPLTGLLTMGLILFLMSAVLFGKKSLVQR